MTLEEAYRQIKASYIHHINERNAILLPQAESIAMDCIQKVIDAQNLEQCIVEHDISFDAFCIYCQNLLNSAKERLERTLSYGETSEYRISELKSAIRLQEQLLGYMMELKEAKRLLKAAIEDLNATTAEVYNGGVICKCCKWESQIGKCSCPDDGGCDTNYQWRYADEALKLIES